MSRRRGDRGAAMWFTLGIAFGFLMLVGLLVDGGNVLRANRRNRDLAAEAARAGAQAVEFSSGAPRVVAGEAEARAEAFLAAAGASGSATVVCAPACDRLSVSVSSGVTMRFLVGLNPTATGTATVRLATGRNVEGG